MSFRNVAVLLCVSLVASGAWAQEAGAPKQAYPKAEPVLSHIPAGSLGFAVIPNAQAAAGRVDKFIADIGLAKMLPSPDPDHPEKKVSVLDLLRGAARLGPGFNPNGGVAVVMLDPNAFGINLLELIPGGPGAKAGPMPMAEPGEAAEKPKPKIPFVIFVPGKSVQDVFGAYPMEAAGKYTLVNLRMGPTYAAKLGSYVVLSPHDKALDAVMAAGKKAAAELPAEHRKIIAASDIAYYINMKVAAPILQQFLTKAVEQIVKQAGPLGPIMGVYMGIYGDLIGQLDAVTVAGRFVPSGLVLDEMVSFQPGTYYAKAMLAETPSAKVPLNALPDLPYVLAVGASGDTSEESAKIGMEMIDSLLKSDLLKALPQEEKDRARKIVEGMSRQITGMQMVGGGAPAGSGLFGLSWVVHCKSAEKVKGLIAEEAAFAQGLVKHFGGDNPDVQKLKIRYVKGMETVGSVTADAVVVEHPDLNEMEEDERSKMKKVLGEDQVRFLVAAADKNTVVITFGGSRNFLVEALKAAAGKGSIGTAPEDAEAMRYLPKKKTAVVLINGANLYQLIVAGMKTMEPDAELPPFKITCKTPISVGVGQTGKSMHVVVYYPTQLVKEVVGIFMIFAGGGPGAAPPVAPDDF
jgi:hypothetical protein